MGGAEIHFHEIFKRIVNMGHNVTLVSHLFSNANQEETIDGIQIKRIGNRYFFDKQFKRFYQSHLQNNNYDLIVDDISKIPLNTPSYINKPIVGILHHIHGNSLYKEIPFPLAYYIIKKEKQIPTYYKKIPIFTVSKSTSSELRDLGFPKNKVEILHNAINHSLFDKIESKKSKTPLLVYIGRIKKYKNIEKVIDTIPYLKEKIPNIKLVIGGSGDHLEALKKYVVKLNLEQYVKFKGFLSEENKAKLFGKAWAFVTMAEKEGWGITVIEANAMKTLAIGSNVPGLRDSIKNNETGFLVPLTDSIKLSKKIESLFLDTNKLNEISKNAYSWSQEFSWENSANHFLTQVKSWYPNLEF